MTLPGPGRGALRPRGVGFPGRLEGANQLTVTKDQYALECRRQADQ